MKMLKISVVLLLIHTTIFSQTYTPNNAGSKIHFVIKNFGIKTGGDFTGLKGSIVFDPKSINSSKFNVSVNAATINTDNSTRDGHLRKSEYFDVQKYPLINFASTKVTNSDKAGHFAITGNLTIKGVTKSVKFDFTATPSGNGYVFKGEFDLNRRDYGVGGSSISMSDNLTVSLSVAANK